MNNPVIQIKNVGKKFCKSLKHSMIYGMKDILGSMAGLISESYDLREGEFWAVDGVSWDLTKGKTLGIIGRNGSGKSTMLKMLNGIFMPDKGKITVHGKVGALIEVGAGFHPLLSGRENIYINGAILGMSKKEIDRKFKAIVDFADIGDFLDAPIKHYSSGMYVRLGFSIAIHCEPDILLVDEVLSVGDLSYALKCHKKMREFRKNGGTVVLVSHNMQAIRNICDEVIWLESGKVKSAGNVMEVCDAYEHYMMSLSQQHSDNQHRINYDSAAKIANVEFMDDSGQSCKSFNPGADLKMRISYDCQRSVKLPIFTVSIYSPDGLSMSSSHSSSDGYHFDEITGKGYVDYLIRKLIFKPAKYACSVVLSEGEVVNILDWHEKKYEFIMSGKMVNDGITNPFPEWKIVS